MSSRTANNRIATTMIEFIQEILYLVIYIIRDYSVCNLLEIYDIILFRNR